MNVQRTADKVWIEGVRGFSPAEYASSVQGCQARILRALGESLSYDDLVCYSGFAFRIGMHDQMCPSSGHPCCGFMCVENGVRAIPWKLKLYEIFSGPKPPAEKAAFEAEVCAAIQAIEQALAIASDAPTSP
ncbi:MAG: hypothetical protein ISS31_06380 [Kiritimatiellae bacterium]|nr:hypothetical protein [Kiritimatiellia bacterium]